jgi:hypothetical protein
LYYHWECTTPGQRFRFQSDKGLLKNIELHPRLAEKTISKITNHIWKAKPPKYVAPSEKQIKANRINVRKRRKEVRKAVRAGKQPVPTPHDVQNYTSSEEEGYDDSGNETGDDGMDVDDDVDEMIAENS